MIVSSAILCIIFLYKGNFGSQIWESNNTLLIESRLLMTLRFIRNTLWPKNMLFGVFAVHSPELCPLNNKNSKKIFLEIQGKLNANKRKFHIRKILGFYMSVLEHEWTIIMDASSAHDIEQLCIAVGISAISTVKIVPMTDYRKAIVRIRST